MIEAVENIKLHIAELRGDNALLEQENRRLKNQIGDALQFIANKIKNQRENIRDDQTLVDRALNAGKLKGLQSAYDEMERIFVNIDL
jgi:regulator of replication initiation timing